jgi:hypothetical protein
MVRDVPFTGPNLDQVLEVIADVANISVAIYKAH